MKQFTALLIFLCFSIISQAQEISKRTEIGILFQNLDEFGVTIRFGKESSVWRLNSTLLNGEQTESNSGNFKIKTSGFGILVSGGKERRKALKEKLDFRYGIDASFIYSYSSSSSENTRFPSSKMEETVSTYQPGINFVAGVNYKLKSNFLIGAELLPGVYYISQNTKIDAAVGTVPENTELTGIGYSVSNAPLLLSISYIL